MVDGEHGGGDEPRQTHEGADRHLNSDQQQVQVVPRAFLSPEINGDYYLKESLHIIYMATLVYEIITLYSPKAILTIIRKRFIHDYFNMPKLSTIYVNYFDVFMREFLVCDVGQGFIGDPLILSKGNPPV